MIEAGQSNNAHLHSRAGKNLIVAPVLAAGFFSSHNLVLKKDLEDCWRMFLVFSPHWKVNEAGIRGWSDDLVHFAKESTLVPSTHIG